MFIHKIEPFAIAVLLQTFSKKTPYTLHPSRYESVWSGKAQKPLLTDHQSACRSRHGRQAGCPVTLYLSGIVPILEAIHYT
ncbi:hypothetical protein [Neobacillus kokaensis]|uniref:hypothetical protein n=1 Tax=Neobacillus kokaensis TaxID=2759023 RepID=UPI00174D4057|nr:hypothetical protein [Neobacillus kokaensis]